MRRLLSILSLLAVLAASPAVAYGRDGFTIKGSVLEKVSRTPIGMSTVLLRENGLWTTTSDDGKFEIAGVAPGTYTIEVSELGYTPFSLKVDVKDNVEGIQIMLDITSLSLNEVVVTAKEGGELTSASRISRQTLEHVQPSSLKDVMQLLPGGITQNPNMTTSAPLSIRDIGSNAANALGTALIVDGATLSNDANMQMLSSGTAINSGTANVTSTAGGGVDARQLSTDNIES
ncbi:MAG: TonB-dependent receptor, partial [Bacteroidales bacterium]|nr:TonB-dependent receptor [Bacteroidales bacterium]